MTPLELQTLIQSIPECEPYIHTNEMPKFDAAEARAADNAIAEIINASGAVTQLQSRLIGYGAVLVALGPVAGAAVLDKLTEASVSVSAIKWAMKLLDAGTLDVGAPETQGQIEQMRGALLTDAETDGLKSMGRVQEHISGAQVSIAMRGPWGDE